MIDRDFRRSIVLSASDHEARGELADDYHHFRVRLRHDGERVTAVEGEAVRFPWSTCPGATARLADLEGMAIGPRGAAVVEHSDPLANCTHLFDLAGLAVAQACRGGVRRYDVHVPRRGEGGATHPTLRRDGTPLLAWDVRGGVIEGPDPFTGVPLRGGFLGWAESHLDVEAAEAAGVLRRMVDLLVLVDLQPADLPHPRHLVPLARPICHTFTNGVIETAQRPPGHVEGGIDWGPRDPLPH